MSSKEAYQRKIKAQLGRWKTTFNGLLTQVEKAGSDAKLKYEGYAPTLRAKRAEMERKLEELKAAGGETWESARAAVEYAWEELRRTTETAISIFQEGRRAPNRDEEIRLIAYHLWEQEGRPEGRQVEHWDKAEANLAGPGAPEADAATVEICEPGDQKNGDDETAVAKRRSEIAELKSLGRPSRHKVSHRRVYAGTIDRKPANGRQQGVGFSTDGGGKARA
jgi:hypothetical protein